MFFEGLKVAAATKGLPRLDCCHVASSRHAPKSNKQIVGKHLTWSWGRRDAAGKNHWAEQKRGQFNILTTIQPCTAGLKRRMPIVRVRFWSAFQIKWRCIGYAHISLVTRCCTVPPGFSSWKLALSLHMLWLGLSTLFHCVWVSFCKCHLQL